MTETTSPADRQYTGDELRAMLTAGAEHAGSLTVRAAVHLLTFTGLPDWRGFRALVDIERVPARVDGERAGGETLGAFIREWSRMADTRGLPLSGSGRRLLDLAVSLAIGQPVDLRDALPGFGHAHARRVLEAVAIATGADHYYTLTGTPALDELRAAHAEMTGSDR